MALLLNFKFLVFLAGAAVAGFFFWPENDEKYLKKTTLKMIDLLVSPLDSSHVPSVIGRVRQVTEPLHFSVKFEVSQNDQVFFKRESASSVRAIVGSYFGSKEKLTLKSVKEENLKVQVSKENSQKTAQVSFLITGQLQGADMSCQVNMGWKHEKEWRIYHIKAVDCQGLSAGFL